MTEAIETIETTHSKSQHELSLSRWHKVIERLTAEMHTLHKSAHQDLAETEVRDYLGEVQIDNLRRQAERGLDALSRAQVIQDCVAEIRSAVSDANKTHGVDAILSQHDALHRRHRVVKDILARQEGGGRVGLEELPQLRQPAEKRDLFGHSSKGVPVRVMNEAQRAALSTELASLAIRTYATADQLADRNRATLTLALPIKMAALAAL